MNVKVAIELLNGSHMRIVFESASGVRVCETPPFPMTNGASIAAVLMRTIFTKGNRKARKEAREVFAKVLGFPLSHLGKDKSGLVITPGEVE